jgi:excisionase family DNA binding protein
MLEQHHEGARELSGTSITSSPPMFMTIDEVCFEARVGRSFVYEQIAAGKLVGTKFGRATRIRRTEFERWLAALPSLKH